MKLTGSELTVKMHGIERREWVLWVFAILVTLLLTVGIVSFSLPAARGIVPTFGDTNLNVAVRGLVGLVLLFDLYAVYQQMQIYRIRHQLVEREELFRLISENAADMIAVVDTFGKRLYNSPAYEKVLGYAPEDLEGTSVFVHVHPDDLNAVDSAVREALEGNASQTIQFRKRHKNGSWRTMESRSSPILDERGKVGKLVIVNRDVTERKSLEEQFRQAQKMEAIGRLSGGVAHDFNNLLGVIIGYAEFIEERLSPSDSLRTSANEILNAGRRAASLTRQLLAFSRQQVLDPKIINLNGAVSDMEKLLRRLIGEDVELSTSLDASLGMVKADQSQLEQVVMNLAVNARDAMPQGGKMIIQTENMVMDQEFVRRYPYPVQPGPYVRLSVTDTGVGMNTETKARAFEPFFTTKEKGKGTGLGLSTVYGVVKQSGGYIDIDSSPGDGTTFKIYLPRVSEVVASASLPASLVAHFGGRETILLAEDEAALRILTRDTLERAGYTVLEAKDGVEALSLSDNHSGAIDLLLTDVVMPGLGGRELSMEMAKRRPSVKVLFMSGYTGLTVFSRGPIDPGSAFIPKPFTRDALTGKIREILGPPVPASV